MERAIVVTGDVFIQENLMAADNTRVCRADGLDAIIIRNSSGGASRTADYLEFALQHYPDVRIERPRIPERPGRALAVWAPKELAHGYPEAKKVWRIQSVLGVERSAGNSGDARITGLAEPDVLLIDDADLGFRDNENDWPRALADDASPSRIVLYIGAGLGKGKLWHSLLDRYADRLTVVLSVALLRANGAAITAPLSWDKTIEETVREFEGDRFAAGLGRARNVVVQFGTDGAAVFTREPLTGKAGGLSSAKVQFARCIYDPENLDGAWAERRPGLYADASRLLAVSLAHHHFEPEAFPLLMAIRHGLESARADHERGGGLASRNSLDLSVPPHPAQEVRTYYAAFPQSLLNSAVTQEPFQSDLLKDYTGAGFEATVTKGIDVVLRGAEAALKPVPKAMFGKYFTVDREEIERINSIRNLIVSYLGNSWDTRPLSFAVFGLPGSGKSFAVKELMRDIAGDGAKSYDFNLSQFTGAADLHQAFHQVRDASVQNQIPFVFWDEFDTDGLARLKDFLVPMQDARFYSGGLSHAFGKAIFIFAGGTASTLQEFDKGDSDLLFRAVKGPDFVSRLRGFINVKGPNPENASTPSQPDVAFVIRRAIMLRKNIEKHAAKLVNRESRYLAMDATLVRAFLTAQKHIHGARSIESIVTMSNLAHADSFGSAELPSDDLLRLHVSKDFLRSRDEVDLDLEEIETLAISAHRAWCDARRLQGVVYAFKRDKDANPPTHNLLVDFAVLPEDKKESNRMTVRSTLAGMASAGYRLRRMRPGSQETTDHLQDAIRDLFRAEHERWLRETLLTGWEWGAKTDPELQVNHNIVPFDELGPDDMPLDEVAVQAVLARLPELGYVLVKDTSAPND